MNMPWRWAAAISHSPGRASMSTPSTVTVTVVFFGASVESDMGRLGLDGAHLRAAVRDVVLELVAEVREGGRQRSGGRRPEHADRGLLRRPSQAGADVVGHVEEQVEVTRAPVAVDDAPQDTFEPRRAFPSRRALATTLLGEEAHEAPARLHHVGGVVHHDDGARAEHRPGLVDGRLVERQVELVGQEPWRRRTTRNEGLQLMTVANAVAELRRFDQLAEGRG